jgi:hypothetical protein
MVRVADRSCVSAVAAVLVDVAMTLEQLDRSAAAGERPGGGEAHGSTTDDRHARRGHS